MEETDSPDAAAPWQVPAVRRAIERRVARHCGRRWRLRSVTDHTDRASHPAAVLADGRYAVFAKSAVGSAATDRLERELAGLELLHSRAGARVPRGIGVLTVGGGAVLIMQALTLVPETLHHWRAVGRQLAQLHRATSDRYGLDRHCFWGDLYQDNTPGTDWPEFFWHRRVAPRRAAALASGHLPAVMAHRLDGLYARWTDLCGPAPAPRLLHGDAHRNNILCTEHGPVMIDPAPYYGHAEVDLAYVDFFTPVPTQLFDAYHELHPIAAGFVERRMLWRIPALLAMVEVEGQRHLGALDDALRCYE